MWGSLITAGVMGIASAINGAQTRKAQRKELAAERDRNLALLDLQFNIARDEANKSADKSDWKSTMNEGYIAANANNQLDQLSASMEQQGLQFNNEAIAAGAQKGNSLARSAASGTRNSSMNTAIDLESAVNAAQLQAEENAAAASNRYNLNNILSQYNNDVFKLQSDRTDAYDLRHSYDIGGNNWNLYAMNRANTEAGYDNQIKKLKTNAMSILSDFGGGASSGYSMGQSIEGLWNDYVKPLGDKLPGNSTMSFDNLQGANDFYKIGKVKLNTNDIFSYY